MTLPTLLVSLYAFLPECYLAATILLMLLYGALMPKVSASGMARTGAVALLLTLFFLHMPLLEAMIAHAEVEGLMPMEAELLLFGGLLKKNGLTLLLETAIASTGTVLLLLYASSKKNSTIDRFEVPILLLLAIFGMMILVTAESFLTFYLGIEMQALSLYVLVAIDRDHSKSSEAAIKYFVLGALASGMMLYGISLLYGYTGTTHFTAMSDAFLSYITLPLVVIVGMICILCGLFFKISAAPFHMWTPDVYEGAPLIITCILATVSKLVGIGISVRVLYEVFGAYIFSWQQVVFMVSALTMLWGALGACRQENIKRLLAYSSIGHVGFVLLAVFAGTQEAMIAALMYTMLYVVMSLGFFACVLRLQKQGLTVEYWRDLTGLIRSHPWETTMMTILLLSMAGIPPLAGFFIKLEVFKAVLATGIWSLPIIGLIATVISTYYYLRIIKIMICDTTETGLGIEVQGGPILLWIGSGMTLLNLGYILLPDVLMQWVMMAF